MHRNREHADHLLTQMPASRTSQHNQIFRPLICTYILIDAKYSLAALQRRCWCLRAIGGVVHEYSSTIQRFLSLEVHDKANHAAEFKDVLLLLICRRSQPRGILIFLRTFSGKAGSKFNKINS